MSRIASPNTTMTLRAAGLEDAHAVARIASLDSASVPTGTLLLGEIDGRALAALSLETGAVVADPFSPTAELVAMLRDRAARVQAASSHGGRAVAVARRLRAARRIAA